MPFNVKIASCLHLPKAALLGQGCVSSGEAKNTYGTGENRIGDQAKKMHADQTKSIEAGQLPQLKKRFITNLIFAGCFMLYNTGKEAVTSTHGLLTTVAYQVTKKQ